MAVFEYLTSTPSGGNPVYISDLTKFASLIRDLGVIATRHNSYNASSNSVVRDIAILSGFDTVGSNQVTPGYIYYRGDIYGFRTDNNLTLGGYLIATKTNTTLRTTKEGTDFLCLYRLRTHRICQCGRIRHHCGSFYRCQHCHLENFHPDIRGPHHTGGLHHEYDAGQ